MPLECTVLGIRHHGPGSARMVARALEHLRPDAVLIEGPPDAAEVLPFAAHADMRPPVALLVYEPDEPRNAAYYPFAEFSPEWQAVRWALSNRSEVRFIDLPWAHRAAADAAAPAASPEPASTDDESADIPGAPVRPDGPVDPLDQLALAAGHCDGEAWWGRLIEERRGEENPLSVFDSIREAMRAARDDHATGGAAGERDARLHRDRQGDLVREAHMRRSIRAAVKEGYKAIAVICGAWHAPVLTTEALKANTAKADDELLKGLPKRKTAATWIPWTYDRLSMYSGYGAGIASPGWYEHLWIHHERLSEHWLTKVARLMRDEDLDASPASVIEAVRLADSLAALRGRAIAGLDELGEATLSILCHGNPLPMRVIGQKLIVGNRLGTVPDDAPSVPLQRDLAAQQRSLRLKVSGDDAELDLDQRTETGLARSRLLHRLCLLKIDWGTLQHDQRQRVSTFHEVWKLQWRAELSVAVIEAARWGNTVAEAAAAFVGDRAANATSLEELTGMLDDVMLAGLPSAVERVIRRITDLSAVAADVVHLMTALPPLARVMRYGNVRRTDVALVEPVVSGLLARICAGLLPACGSLDDDAAAAMRIQVDQVNTALATLDNDVYLCAWRSELQRLGDADVHGLVAGRAWRILLDSGHAGADSAAERFSLALSPGNNPEESSAWLEGFLGGSGMVLVHDDRLLAIVDEWVSSLQPDVFDRICPIVRRTFSTFEKPERRQIGEKLKRGAPAAGADASGSGERALDEYDAARGALVEPVIRLILGDRLP